MYIIADMFSAYSLLSLCMVVSASSLREHFENWAYKFGVTFTGDFHKQGVFAKWVNNHRFIEEVNSKNLSYVLGHNQFSGMDFDEYKKYLMANRRVSYGGEVISTYINANVSLPASIDWVAKGAVTGVKDQGQCGSCWSFSTTGALEGAYYLKYGVLASFSEQQLVDCDNFANGGRNHGCNGGSMELAFNWIKNNGGICSEDSYPYVSGKTSTNGKCSQCSVVKGSAVKGYKKTDVSDAGVMSALQIGPLSVGIDAESREFQLYKSGVFSGNCGTTLDHGVLLVGYGEESEVGYYKIKNSWSESWGENGYIRIGRGEKYAPNGQCGVLLDALYPFL